ncbi:MAG: serine/threonine protein kinase [Steroidobacteraceae bacterium]
MTEDWTKWENLVINGVFPLRRFLGKSDHSVVFLTDCKSQRLPDAAIKLIPAGPNLAEALLAQWRTAAALAHPHLIRVFESGRCQLGGQDFIFVVMEYAEQTLAQILPNRPLTSDEVRELVLPSLDALAFLHRKNLVHGQLKPPNFLVVQDQLKLASDNIRPAGPPTARSAKSSVYDPPEVKDGSLSAAGDIWGLGVVIVEALTQSPPEWADQAAGTVSVPAALPATYVDIVRRCLSRNRAGRPSIGELEAQIKVAQQASVAPPARALLREAPVATARKLPRARWLAVGVAGIVIAAAIWIGLRSMQSHPNSQQPAPATAAAVQDFSQLAATPAAAAQNPKASMSTPSPVLHQEIPDVPRSARESIHGNIKVTVRVSVDRAGNVVGATLEDRGSSKYFARLATEAARKWKFVAAQDQPSRAWRLRFEFTRGGAAAHALLSRS